jgi:hypothetical protein
VSMIAGGTIRALSLQPTVAAYSTEGGMHGCHLGDQGSIVADEIDDQFWRWF